MTQVHRDTQDTPHKFVYVIVRNDLSIPQKAVQSCHAVIEATKAFKQPEEHPSVIICTVPSEYDLVDYFSRLEKNNISFKVFQEPDLDNQFTALATEPIYGKHRKVFSNLPLLRGGEPAMV